MPINCPGGVVYVIKSGDTLYSISQRYNTTVTKIVQANPGINPNNLQIGQEICIPVAPSTTCPGGINYTIKSGDTLYAIAARYGVTVNDILRLNPGINPNNLQIGQVICIPRVELPPVPRPRCIILSPTDLAPNSKGALFIETELGSVVGILTNVPAPTVLPGGEVYKLWIKTPGSTKWQVTTMTEVFPDYWVGRVVPGVPLTGSDVIISAEAASNVTAPAGMGVATGII